MVFPSVLDIIFLFFGLFLLIFLLLSPTMSFSKFLKEYLTLCAPVSYGFFSITFLYKNFFLCSLRMNPITPLLAFVFLRTCTILTDTIFMSYFFDHSSEISTLSHPHLAQQMSVTPKTCPLTFSLSLSWQSTYHHGLSYGGEPPATRYWFCIFMWMTYQQLKLHIPKDNHVPLTQITSYSGFHISAHGYIASPTLKLEISQ